MGKKTKIQYVSSTWNPWVGCTKISPGCTHCYASTQDTSWGNDRWGPGKPREFTSDAYWRKPLAWQAEAKRTGKPHSVFCASLADVFDAEAPEGGLARVWNLIEACPDLTWLLLTKRPERITASLPPNWGKKGWKHVRLGATVETQKMADLRIPELLNVPGTDVLRYLSMEPLLEEIDIEYPKTLYPDGPPGCCNGFECGCYGRPTEPPLWWGGFDKSIGWIIVGAESGEGARPMNEDWVRRLRDQASSAKIPFFYKQRLDPTGEKVSLPELDGRTWAEFPDSRGV